MGIQQILVQTGTNFKEEQAAGNRNDHSSVARRTTFIQTDLFRLC